MVLAASADLSSQRSAQDGEEAARREWAALYVALGPKIAAYCTRLLGSRESGEDAAQDVFVKAARWLPVLQQRGELRQGWLYTVAQRRCLDELRRRGRVVPESVLGAHLAAAGVVLDVDATPLEAVAALRQAQEKPVYAWGAVPRAVEEEAVDGITAGQLIGILRSAPLTRTQQVALRQHLQGRSYAESADAEGKTTASMKAALYRARVVLRAGRVDGTR